VVIVAPVAAGTGFMASPRRQAAALTAAGARVALIRPDRAALRAIGRNVSRRAAARAGRAQAAAEAPAVRAVWQA
jgi:NTE family protein